MDAKEEGADVIPMVKELKKKTTIKSATSAIAIAKPKRGKVTIDREAIHSQIRRVRLNSIPEEPKKKRGRPAGNLNKATLARSQAAQ